MSELRSVSTSYTGPHGRVEAVRGIDVTIDTGDTVALLGERRPRPRRGRTVATPDAPEYHPPTMADERELSLQEELEGIGAQLDWVRGYL